MKIKSKVYEFTYDELEQQLGLKGKIISTLPTPNRSIEIEIAYDKDEIKPDPELNQWINHVEDSLSWVDVELEDDVEVGFEFIPEGEEDKDYE